jgi:uncharacterized protein
MWHRANLQSKRDEYRRLLKTSLQRMVDYLSGREEVRLVVLFGSYARGRQDLFTDLDLLVVMETEKDFLSRTAELYRELGPKVDLDLIVYTPEEFARNRDKGFIRTAMEEGKVLYEKKRS